MMAQAMIGMALSDPSSEVPVTPAFSQETKENATSIVITLTKK